MSPRVNPNREIFQSPIVQFVQAVIDVTEPLPVAAHAQIFDSARSAFPTATVQFGAGWRHGPAGPDPMLFAFASEGDSAVLFSHSVIAETVRYERFERFADHVQAAADLIDELPGVDPLAVTLRYVDEIRLPNPEPALNDFAPYVNFPVHPSGPLGQRSTQAAGVWTFTTRDGCAVVMEWAYTQAPAIDPGHPLSAWYTAPDRAVLVLDWTCHQELSGTHPDVPTALTAAYGAIKECFDEVVTDDCRALMRHEEAQ